MSVAYLDQTDPAIYRNARGRPGADPLMSRDVGTGGRYVITTGEAAMVNGGNAALPNDWRRVLDPRSPAFAVIVLGAILFLIHGSIGVGASGSVKAGLRK